MAYERKTKDVYILMGNYGYGWEEEVFYDDLKEAKQDLRTYRAECPHFDFYIKKKRERI